MKKIKLLTTLSSLPILGMMPISFASCGHDPSIKQFRIDFSCSEGVSLSGATLLKVNENTKWGDIKDIPTVNVEDAYLGIGWYDVSEMKKITSETIITKDTQAKYIALDKSKTIVNVTVNVDDKIYGPAPFIQGATFAQFKEYYPEMKKTPTKEHYKFQGWGWDYTGEGHFIPIENDDWTFPEDRTNITILSAFTQIIHNVSTAGSSQDVTFNYFPSTLEDGKNFESGYVYDKSLLMVDEVNSDILVGSKSIKDQPGVVYKDGVLKIPASLITGDIQIKIITTTKDGYISTDWSTIISACNTFENSDRGSAAITAFLSNFSIKGKTTLSSLNDLVGSWKDMTINNKKHVVKIIDTQHDTISSTNQTAALTFELFTILSYEDGLMMECKWDASNNHDYTNSILRKNLTGNGTGSLKWFKPGGEQMSETKTALQMLPSELQPGIKEVKKSTTKTISLSPTQHEVIEYTDKLFPLTYTEMAQSGSKYAKVEGTAYKYWIEHNDNESRKKWQIKSYGLDTYCLCSPYLYGGTTAFYVDPFGAISSREVATIEPVSFAFCI